MGIHYGHFKHAINLFINSYILKVKISGSMVTPQHEDPSNIKTASMIGEGRSRQTLTPITVNRVIAAFTVPKSPSPNTDSAIMLLRRMPALVLTCFGCMAIHVRRSGN